MEVIRDFVPVVRPEFTNMIFGVLNLSPKGEQVDEKKSPISEAGGLTRRFVTEVLAKRLDPLGRVLARSLDYLNPKDADPRAAYALGFLLVAAPLYTQEGDKLEQVVLNFSSGDQTTIFEKIKNQKPKYEWPDAFYDAYYPVDPLPERQPDLRALVAIASPSIVNSRYTHLVKAAALGLYNGLALVYPENTDRLLPVDVDKNALRERLQEWERRQRGFEEYKGPERLQVPEGLDVEQA